MDALTYVSLSSPTFIVPEKIEKNHFLLCTDPRLCCHRNATLCNILPNQVDGNEGQYTCSNICEIQICSFNSFGENGKNVPEQNIDLYALRP